MPDPLDRLLDRALAADLSPRLRRWLQALLRKGETASAPPLRRPLPPDLRRVDASENADLKK